MTNQCLFEMPPMVQRPSAFQQLNASLSLFWPLAFVLPFSVHSLPQNMTAPKIKDNIGGFCLVFLFVSYSPSCFPGGSSEGKGSIQDAL